MKATALIAGATGFIGSHLARRLVHDGYDVHILCRKHSNFWRLDDILPCVHRHVAPLEDKDRLAEVIRIVRPDHIFNLAAATVVAGASAGPEELIAVNLLGTVNLVAACEATEYRSLIVTGDSFEYSSSHAPLCESSACRPDSLHGITKLAATLHAQSIAATRGRPVVTLRLFSTYGPGDNPRRLVPRMISGARAGTPLSLSRPEIARDWIYIDDVVSLYVEAAGRASELAGGVFNVGSGERTDLSQIVEMILRLTGSLAEVRWGVFPAPPHDAYPWIADMRHTLENFAWRPTMPLEAGLRMTISATP
jgi:nucleoside-diphosphate-sugar epimerase